MSGVGLIHGPNEWYKARPIIQIMTMNPPCWISAHSVPPRTQEEEAQHCWGLATSAGTGHMLGFFWWWCWGSRTAALPGLAAKHLGNKSDAETQTTLLEVATVGSCLLSQEQALVLLGLQHCESNPDIWLPLRKVPHQGCSLDDSGLGARCIP